MSRTFTDSDLLTWEAFSSGGQWGLPEQPKIVFHCLSDPNRPALAVIHDGQSAEAQDAVMRASNERLLEMLKNAEPL